MERQYNNEDKSLYAALSEYGRSDYYPYHMPGHKRSAQAGEMAKYYGIDITEIDGFDNLHHAEGILRMAQQRANRLYGAEETFYLVGGSTCGVLAAIMAVAGHGEEILIARNCHKSVYHAAIMQELQVRYCYPSMIQEYGICDGVSAADIESLLEQYSDCKAVVITSPTYEGILSDIGAITDVVHKKNKILIVDEAHGAHLGLAKEMPKGAVAYGADLVIHSLHKTLPAMTQTALLHVQGERVDCKKLRRYLAMLQTSSPSYVMMASMDSCVRYVEKHGAEGFARMRRQYDFFCKKTENCKYLKIGKMTEMSENSSDLRRKYCLAGWDIGKLVIFIQGTALNGQQLYDILREEYHLQMEMAAGNYVVAIMTIMDTEQGWQRLADAIVQIDDRIEEETAQNHVVEIKVQSARSRDGCGGEASDNAAYRVAEARMTPAQAFHSEQEEISLDGSIGRVVADFINLYPPGIPLLVPGEVMNGETLAHIRESVRMGLTVQGVTADGKAVVVK
ncbi:MAG: aminotransferase class I/II-fold pyridoxal phosphate-dependent enzyme [Eubacterium sp.]|nr:aminotransferase class I/II-fold pyridoxal phosphate-dependent enzyme [Eubacterium sp.]